MTDNSYSVCYLSLPHADQGIGPRVGQVSYGPEKGERSHRNEHQEASDGVPEAQEDVRAAAGPDGRSAVQHRADHVRDRFHQGHCYHGKYLEIRHVNHQNKAEMNTSIMFCDSKRDSLLLDEREGEVTFTRVPARGDCS